MSIKKINKFIEHSNYDLIIEMARINDIIKYPYDVFVYGGNSYGSGRNEHGKPHFHFADKIKGGNWQFSVLIPTVDEWKQNKDLYIYETSNGEYNWRGFKDEKKSLIEWLDLINEDLSFYTNLEVIRYNWNTLNKDNKNVSQIKRIL